MHLVAKYGIGGIRTREGFHYYLDAPKNWALTDYRTKVVGWCVHPGGNRPTGMRIAWEGGQVLGRYGEPRPDVSHAFNLPKQLETCGFKISIALPAGTTHLRLDACDKEGVWHHLGDFVAKVPRRIFLPFWRKARSDEDPAESYESWIDHYERPTWRQRQVLRRKARSLPYKPLISVLLPTYNTPPQWLKAAIESIRKQTYPHWELCISDDASTDPKVHDVLRWYARRDSRIKITLREANGHISASSNSALALATGEFAALLDHDDEFSPYALYAVALELNRTPDLDLIYSDEDKIDEHGWRFDPYFKSDWNPDLLNVQNCVSHLGVYRTQRLRDIGGFQEGVEGCQDWDIALRIMEGVPPTKARHIPRVLYHWRAIPGSTALALDQKSYIDASGYKMLTEHFARIGQNVEVEPVEGGHWRVKYLIERHPLVTIIIPTRNQTALLRQCIESVESLTSYKNYELLIVDNLSGEPDALAYLRELAGRGIRVLPYNKAFNYSAINNLAVTQAQGELICFLNNDMEVITPEWLEEMVSHALRSDIGAVGAKLLFPDRTLQHTGIILGLGGPAGHILYKFNSNTGGYYNRARLVCNYSAVTAACMVIRKALFEEVGGFDERNLAVSYNDVDLCLRLQELGYRNIYTPSAQLYHHESASRGEDAEHKNYQRARREIAYMWQRWGDLLLEDPAYNPNLSLQREDYSLAAPPRIPRIWEKTSGHRAVSSARQRALGQQPSDSSGPPVVELGRTTTSAAEVVLAGYKCLLKSTPEPEMLHTLTNLLENGATVQKIVAEIARSERFRESVASESQCAAETVKLCCSRLLARPADDHTSEQFATVLPVDLPTLSDVVIYSREFNNRFGAQTLPYPPNSPELRVTFTPPARGSRTDPNTAP